MITDAKFRNKLNLQQKEIQALRSRVSELSDQTLLLEDEIKGFKKNVSRDISTLLERVEILKNRILKQ